MFVNVANFSMRKEEKRHIELVIQLYILRVAYGSLLFDLMYQPHTIMALFTYGCEFKTRL